MFRRFSLPAALLLLTLAPTGRAYCQSDSLAALTRQLTRYQQTVVAEKLFLHLDRPFYLTGETMWFKAYTTDGNTNRPLAFSTVAYVEVLDGAQRPVLQGKVALKAAAGAGSFVLPTALASGTYTVRAYTSWMRNFGPDTYFHTTITVLNPAVASGGPLSKDSARYDARFFPEGGNLVQGLNSRVAFKVTDRAGKGVVAQGRILNQRGQEVATFRTQHAGMGSFVLTPEAGTTYLALVTVGQAAPRRYPLPRVYAQGYVLQVQDQGPAGLLVSVSSTQPQPETVLLLGHARQQAFASTRVALVDGRGAVTIARNQLPEGIAHFTLFNAGQQPLCERLYFRQPEQRLQLAAQLSQPQYPTRAPVRVQVTATGANQPAGAALSMAVYRLDSLATTPSADIYSYLWLSSDLRGEVENPAYYFTATSAEARLAADHLMLTQGWSRFRWEQVLPPAAPLEFLPELHGPLVRGRVTHRGSGAPAPGLMTYLASPSRIIALTNAKSDANGFVQFEAGNLYGTRELVVQVDQRQDSTSQVELFSPFSTQYGPTTAGSYTALSRFQADYARRSFQAQVQSAYFGQYKNRFLLPSADSAAFYGKADETYLLDKYTRFKILEEVMREYVPGVIVRRRKEGARFSVADKLNHQYFSDDPLILLDGVPVFNVDKMLAMDPLKIQKLEVIDNHFFQGPTVHSGIVSYTTYRGNLEGFPLDAHALVQQYEGLQLQREFYAPRYDTPQARQSRLPDLRNLLYWNPDVRTTGAGPTPLEFYTGDQAGRYLVVVQGLADSGLAGSSTATFEVKPAL